MANDQHPQKNNQAQENNKKPKKGLSKLKIFFSVFLAAVTALFFREREINKQLQEETYKIDALPNEHQMNVDRYTAQREAYHKNINTLRKSSEQYHSKIDVLLTKIGEPNQPKIDPNEDLAELFYRCTLAYRNALTLVLKKENLNPEIMNEIDQIMNEIDQVMYEPDQIIQFAAQHKFPLTAELNDIQEEYERIETELKDRYTKAKENQRSLKERSIFSIFNFFGSPTPTKSSNSDLNPEPTPTSTSASSKLSH